jgi:hypothetical protein
MTDRKILQKVLKKVTYLTNEECHFKMRQNKIDQRLLFIRKKFDRNHAQY